MVLPAQNQTFVINDMVSTGKTKISTSSILRMVNGLPSTINTAFEFLIVNGRPISKRQNINIFK